MTPEALKELVSKPELLALTEGLAPAQTVAFWMPESEMEALELELGAGVRLKTRGDGPFLGEQRSPHGGLPGFRRRLPDPGRSELVGPAQVWPPWGQDPLSLIPEALDPGCCPKPWFLWVPWGSHPGVHTPA